MCNSTLEIGHKLSKAEGRKKKDIKIGDEKNEKLK